MRALAAGTTSIVIRGEGVAPLRRLTLVPAIWRRAEVVEARAASMTGTDRLPPAAVVLRPDAGLNDPLRTTAIAAYRRCMTAPAPEAKGALLIDTYI